MSRTPASLSQQRFAARSRARRWGRVRRVAGAAVVVAALVAGVWAVGWSSVLGLREVRVEGTRTVAAAEVQRLVDVPRGTPLVRVDTAAVAARVGAIPAVERVDVSRAMPGTVVVTVTERRPVAVLRAGGKHRLLDRHGVAYADVSKVPSGLPVVEAPADAPAQTLRDAVTVVTAIPAAVRTRVLAVTAPGPNALGLRLRGARTVVWGGAADSPKKALVLQALLRQKAKVYDVSAPNMPTTRA